MRAPITVPEKDTRLWPVSTVNTSAPRAVSPDPAIHKDPANKPTTRPWANGFVNCITTGCLFADFIRFPLLFHFHCFVFLRTCCLPFHGVAYRGNRMILLQSSVSVISWPFMELRHLRYFAAVAQHLNYTQAARHLHVAQPAISQTILDLEDELGVKLLLRNKRRVRLSVAGTVFLRKISEILRRADEAKRMAQRAARGEIGRVAIGFMVSAAS